MIDWFKKFYRRRKVFTVLLVSLFVVPLHFASANIFLENFSGTVFKTFSLITGVVAEVIRNLLVLVAPLLDTLVQSSFNSEDLFVDAPFVVIGWTLVRDFANILFILIFVVVAIGTILGIQAYSARRLLPKLIGVALVVNFSRVIAGFLIDIAQAIMLYFLQFGILASDRDISIVLALMNGMQLDKLTSLTFDGNNPLGTIGSFWNAITNQSAAELQLQDVMINIMTIVFMGAAAAVFFWIAWTLIVRIVALWVLIIIAPVAWVIGILPAGAGMMKSWWENFFKWNFVGISVGFFLFLSMLLLQSFNTLNFGEKFTDVKYNEVGISSSQAVFADRGGLDAFLVGQAGFLSSTSPILMYATVISFLYFSVNAAKKGSAFGAGVIVDKGLSVFQNRAKRAVMWAPRGAGRVARRQYRQKVGSARDKVGAWSATKAERYTKKIPIVGERVSTRMRKAAMDRRAKINQAKEKVKEDYVVPLKYYESEDLAEIAKTTKKKNNLESTDLQGIQPASVNSDDGSWRNTMKIWANSDKQRKEALEKKAKAYAAWAEKNNLADAQSDDVLLEAYMTLVHAGYIKKAQELHDQHISIQRKFTEPKKKS